MPKRLLLLLALLGPLPAAAQSRWCLGRTNAEVTVELRIALAEYHQRKDQTAEEIVGYDLLEVLEASEHLIPAVRRSQPLPARRAGLARAPPAGRVRACG